MNQPRECEDMNHLERIKQDWRALRKVPELEKTQDMFDEAVRQSLEALHYVPDRFKTPELLKLAEKP